MNDYMVNMRYGAPPHPGSLVRPVTFTGPSNQDAGLDDLRRAAKRWLLGITHEGDEAMLTGKSGTEMVALANGE